MISTAPGSYAFAALTQIVRWPGEIADRRIAYGRIVVASPPEVGKSPPTRWVERLRAEGLLRPARVRRMPCALAPRIGFLTGERWRHLEGEGLRIMGVLVASGDEGLLVADLAGGDPSGALERTLQELYRVGLASPPAALWATEAGRALVKGRAA